MGKLPLTEKIFHDVCFGGGWQQSRSMKALSFSPQV